MIIHNNFDINCSCWAFFAVLKTFLEKNKIQNMENEIIHSMLFVKCTEYKLHLLKLQINRYL